MQVLVVDSSAISRRFIREELVQGGYEVLESDRDGLALDLFQEHRPALVTLGTEIGERSGFELCESIRALEQSAHAGSLAEPLVPVVFVTADDTLEGRGRGFRAGATDFVKKPFVPGQLLQVVNTILKPRRNWADPVGLVVEDSRITRHVVADAMRRMGVQVLEARDGREAWELLEHQAQRIAIIVSDLRMPHMDGRELCERIRAVDALRDVPFIALSAASDRAAVMDLFEAGATDYLMKPFALEELIARIKVHLDARQLMHDLERRNQDLREDLKLASAVQRASLHDRCEAAHVRKAVCYRPQGEVSGDIYDFSVTDRADFNVFLGDAIGHGVAAAFMTMMVQTGLDGIGPNAPLETTLKRLHGLIHERSGDRFVTAVYARLSPTGQFEYASAGHPPSIWMPRRGEATLLDTEGGLPLGLLKTTLPFGLSSVQLQVGDRVFFYSDGLIEWARGDGTQFTAQRVVEWLQEQRELSLEACVQGLALAAERFAEGAPADDVTVVGLEYRTPDALPADA